MSADTWWLEVIFLLLHHAKQARELTAPSNLRQVWDLVLVSVTSLKAQNTGGQTKQKLHFCPSTRETLLAGTGEGTGLKSGRVAGVLACSI